MRYIHGWNKGTPTIQMTGTIRISNRDIMDIEGIVSRIPNRL